MSSQTKPLNQIQNECISAAKTTFPTVIQKGKLYKWKGNITSFASGILEFRFLPNFGPGLLDETGHIPCILVDPVKNAKKLIPLCNYKVLLKDPEFVVEVFITDRQENSIIYVFLHVEKLEKLMINEDRPIITPVQLLKDFRSSNKDVLSQTSWNQKIIPLKISSTILTPKSEVICFVLVILVNEENQNNKKLIWLILKNSDVVWKDLLIPNKMFNINIPSEISVDYFCRHGSIYSFFDRSWDLPFSQMLHHKDLLKTCSAVFFPKNSKINTLNKNIEIDTHTEKWFHISDPDLKAVNFASVHGRIKEIRYVEAWKTYNCSWCNKFDNVFEETINEQYQDEQKQDEDIIDFKGNWCTPTSFIENTIDDVYPFPEIPFEKRENQKISGFGIRGGKLTVQITLQKNYSNEVSYVFLKRWKLSQYPAGLIPGMTVCFTDVNVKRSKKKYFYFISTPLTRIIHLETTILQAQNIFENWGPFGFPFTKNRTEKLWGVLDLDLLTKVSISAKCKLCNGTFLQYFCSNVFCSNSRLQMTSDYTVIAVARVFVRGFQGFESTNLYLKDENVQKYLCLPERIWKKLGYLSASSELIYLYSDKETDDENCDIVNIFFRRYCKFFRPRPRFHVLCRPFKNEGEEPRFFCIALSEISDSRIDILRTVIKNKSKTSMETNTC